MAIQLPVLVRNARLDAIETWGGASMVLKIRTGAQPATPETADSGTVVATITCGPTDAFSAAGSGQMLKSGTWQDASADSSADVSAAGHFRLYKSDGTTCVMQGTVRAPSGGDLNLDNGNIVAGQTVTINTFTLTDGNA